MGRGLGGHAEWHHGVSPSRDDLVALLAMDVRRVVNLNNVPSLGLTNNISQLIFAFSLVLVKLENREGNTVSLDDEVRWLLSSPNAELLTI